MNNNRTLWDRVFVTDPAFVKPITGKQYKGSSPSPYWIVQRLTDEFGPCGIGWGFVVVNERFERLTPDDVLHVATVRLWYVLEGKRGELEQLGQTKAVYKSKNGTMVDEDAPKKSVTDALVKCASYLGFAGDIFSGRWDDSRYVQEAAEEWDERKHAEADKQRAAWIDARIAEINAAKSSGELKAVLHSALDYTRQKGDAEAGERLSAAAQAKIATAKAKAAQEQQS